MSTSQRQIIRHDNQPRDYSIPLLFTAIAILVCGIVYITALQIPPNTRLITQAQTPLAQTFLTTSTVDSFDPTTHSRVLLSSDSSSLLASSLVASNSIQSTLSPSANSVDVITQPSTSTTLPAELTSPVNIPSPTNTSNPCVNTVPNGFCDDFSNGLDRSRWFVSDESAFWQQNGITGRFDPSRVSYDGAGHIKLNLHQQRIAGSIQVSAGEFSTTREDLHYGMYEMRVRTGSTSPTASGAGSARSGNITGIFNYISESLTEIDHEIGGSKPTAVDLSVWKTTSNNSDTQYTASPAVDYSQAFHIFKWNWQPTYIDFYVDGVLVLHQTKVIPTAPAAMFFNLWPTNEASFGGLNATPNDGSVLDLYMYVDYFKYTP